MQLLTCRSPNSRRPSCCAMNQRQGCRCTTSFDSTWSTTAGCSGQSLDRRRRREIYFVSIERRGLLGPPPPNGEAPHQQVHREVRTPVGGRGQRGQDEATISERSGPPARHACSTSSRSKVFSDGRATENILPFGRPTAAERVTPPKVTRSGARGLRAQRVYSPPSLHADRARAFHGPRTIRRYPGRRANPIKVESLARERRQ